MRRKDLTPEEVRVLGCLVEKQRTTPDAYPLTLNSLRLACNQSTNRDPVVDYDDATVRTAAERLARRRLARFASGHGSRAAKYRHLLGEELGLEDDELAVLCVLMLRGPQTPGELGSRGERLYAFEGIDGVHEALSRLAERELVERLDRRPGQKEERYSHRVSEDLEEAAGPTQPVSPVEPAPTDSLGARIDRLERELAELQESVAALRAILPRDG